MLAILLGACASPPPPTPPAPDWLWVAVWGQSKVVAFDENQLTVGGDAVTPRRAFGLGATNYPYAIAFDADGNLWAGTQGGLLLRIDAADLLVSGTPTPGVTLDTGSSDVNGMAFGPDDRLWVATAAGLLAYRPDQLLASGTPTPDVQLTGTATYPLSYPAALAFDADGGLWVAAHTFVARYAPAQLAASGAPEPDVVLESDGTSLANARGVGFDAGLREVLAAGHPGEREPLAGGADRVDGRESLARRVRRRRQPVGVARVRARVRRLGLRRHGGGRQPGVVGSGGGGRGVHGRRQHRLRRHDAVRPRARVRLG